MKTLSRWGLIVLCIIAIAAAASTLSGKTVPVVSTPLSSVRAPEFPTGLNWINTQKPLSLKKLHGKVVLLDFWTYGCINCIHIIPDLGKLQKKYADNLAIIGVHSAKFQNEKSAVNIRNAVLRYHIEHPVVVDKNLQIWNAYNANAWPTLILITPDGKIAGRWAGEGQFGQIDSKIKNLISTFGARHELDKTPLKMALASAGIARTSLLFPGKVLFADGKVYVADSGHNRIVQTNTNGKVLSIIGSGISGLKDGSFNNAQFDFPQGMALSANGKVLFVADTDNHAIRAVNFETQKVTTIAGTGKQASYGASGGVGTHAALSSPWDLCRVGNILYIAMAGNHQLWSLNLTNKKVSVFAGSGAENRTDGARRFAAFAQPSGLATNGKVLFVADSESSSIRQVDLPGHGNQVKTLAGGNLFDFGDRNGIGLNARFQHPLGMATDGKVLFIADAYNHQIRKLNLANDKVTTLLGSKRGMALGKNPMFYEPGGLSLAGNSLYIADTNNNRIDVANLQTGNVRSLDIKAPFNPPKNNNTGNSKPLNERDITVPKVLLTPSSKSTFTLNLGLPARHHLNQQSPQNLKIKINGKGVSFTKTQIDKTHFKLPLKLTFNTAKNGSGTILADANVYYCTNNFGVCEWRNLKFTIPYQISKQGKNNITLSRQIKQ